MDNEEKKTKKVKMVKIRIVKQSPENAMVEFTLGRLLQRALIPSNLIEDDKVAEDVLLLGIPYGVPWELVELKANPIDLANALRIMDIWTYEDAMSKPNSIISALQAVYGTDLAQILSFARENK